MNDYKPDRKSVGDLFRQSKRLVIPRYQRSYEWRDANIQDFYSDFVSTQDGNLNFLGNIVVDASDDTKYEVIDGQQRLITLTILSAVIRDILKEDLGTQLAVELATNVNSTFLKMGASFAGGSNSEYKLTPSKDLEEFFMYYVQDGGETKRKQFNTSKKPSHKHVVNAYTLFRKLITSEKLSGNHSEDQKVEFLRKVVDRIDKITLILIEVYDQNVAYAIFESFNAKRVDLSIADLVKNYYFSKLNGPDTQVQPSMDRWDNIVSRINSLPGGKLDRFLHYYFQSREGRFPKSQLYRKIRVDVDEDAGKFIKNLEASTILYTQLKDSNIEQTNIDPIPYEWLKRINVSLEGINRFNVEQCFILLLSVMTNKHKLTPRFTAKIIELIERFTFIYSKIDNGQANILESVYGDFAKTLAADKPDRPEIYAGQIYSGLLEKFKEQLPGLESFEAKFKELDYEKPQDKKLVQYIFEKIEVHNTKGGTMLGDYSNIDHIFPQNPPQGIKALSNRHRIGNLLPIDRATNSKIGNQLPYDKIKIYKKLKHITQVSDYLDFTEEYGVEMTDDLIGVRGSLIAKKAYNEVWFVGG